MQQLTQGFVSRIYGTEGHSGGVEGVVQVRAATGIHSPAVLAQGADADLTRPAFADPRPPAPRQQEQRADALPVRRWAALQAFARFPASPRPLPARSISISDGQNSMQGMLSTSLNEHVESGQLKQGSIARIAQFLVSDLSKGSDAKCAPARPRSGPHRPSPGMTLSSRRRGHRIAIILQLDVVQLDAELIGNPVAMDQAPAAAQPAANGAGNQPAAMKGPGASAGATQRAAPSGNFTPLKALNPYSTRWRIKARCVACAVAAPAAARAHRCARVALAA